MQRPITNGLVSGADIINIPSGVLGGVMLGADNTNAATTVLRRDSETGPIIFQAVTKAPLWVPCQIIVGSTRLYYSVSGTGAGSQIYEHVA